MTLIFSNSFDLSPEFSHLDTFYDFKNLDSFILTWIFKSDLKFESSIEFFAKIHWGYLVLLSKNILCAVSSLTNKVHLQCQVGNGRFSAGGPPRIFEHRECFAPCIITRNKIKMRFQSRENFRI